MKCVLTLLLASVLQIIPCDARAQDVASKQEVGTIRGTIFDPQGAVISGADIRATNGKTGEIFVTKSTDEGAFVLTALPFGDYSVLITAPGFAKYHTQVALRVENSQPPHNATMQVALGDIRIDAHMIDVGTGVTVCIVCGYTYFSIPYSDLPLMNRDPQQLVMLQPGVTEHKGGFSIGGRRLENKTSLLDGFDNRDSASGRFAVSLSLEALSEFNIDYTNADTTVSSSYGQNNAPLLSAAGKSGTNTYHGQGLWLVQRTGPSANNFFTNRGGLPPDQRMFDQAAFTFGGNISAPGLFRGTDHAFFFLSYDQTRDHEARGEQVIAPLASFVERTSGVQGPLFRSLLSNNRIPLAIGPGLKDVDGDGLNDIGDAAVRSSSSLARRLALVRIDLVVTSQFNINSRYYRDESRRINDLNERMFTPSSPLHDDRKGELAAMQFVSIINPRSINELRLAYLRNRSIFGGAGSDAPQLIALNSPLEVGGGLPEVPEQRSHRAFIIGDLFSHVMGAHSVVIGMETIRRDEHYSTAGLAQGRIYYSDVLALVTDGTSSVGDPLRSIVRGELLESEEFDRRQFGDYNAFANDNWRAGPRFVINYGTSYSVYSGAIYGGQTDRNNFAPFASFAFGPTRSESVILRGGVSMLYAPPARLPYGEINATPLYPLSTGFARPDEIAGSPLPRMWTDRNGVLEIESEYNQKIRTTYTESAFFFVQNSIDNKLIVEAGYVGTVGHKLNRAYRLGRVSPGTLFSQTNNPSDAEKILIDSDANSSYHSMQLKVTSRERRRLTFQAHYTFSKAIDVASDDRPSIFRSLRLGPVHENGPALERGLADFDRRHRVVGFFLWRGPELDRLQTRFRWILADWQFSGIVTRQSGPPLTVYSGGDFYGGLGDFNRDGVLNDRPVYSGTGSVQDSIRHGASPADGYFDARLFTKPGTGGREELGRNVLHGPGYGSIDLSGHKKFRITDGHQIEIRAYGFNVTNRTNFASPVGDLVSADFGRSVEATLPRTIRFAIRYSF